MVACTLIGQVFGLTAKRLACQQSGIVSDLASVHVWNLTLAAFGLILVVRCSAQSRDRIADDTDRTVELSRALATAPELEYSEEHRQPVDRKELFSLRTVLHTVHVSQMKHSANAARKRLNACPIACRFPMSMS